MFANRAAAEPADRTSGDQEGHRVAPTLPGGARTVSVALPCSPPSPQASRRPGRVAAGSGQPGVVLFPPGGIVPGHGGSSAGTGRLIAVGTAATGGVVLAGTAAQLIGYELFHGRIPALNSASDGGLFGLVGDIS